MSSGKRSQKTSQQTLKQAFQRSATVKAKEDAEDSLAAVLIEPDARAIPIPHQASGVFPPLPGACTCPALPS